MQPDRLAELEQALYSDSLDRRKAALDELAQVPSELAVPILQRLSTTPDFLLRRLAVMGLGNHRSDQSLHVLKQLLEQETDANVLAEVANSLFEFGEMAVPLLEQLFYRNQHWLTRQSIISILMESSQVETLLSVIRVGLQDETQAVKETAILALGTLVKGTTVEQAALDLLAQLAEAPNWRDRWRAATALTLSPDPRAKQLLAKLRQDENHYVVAAALESNVT
jgi:HEAT repeat protein